ncbi:flavin reductase family protein [Roseomonas terrae]|jgi:flavin reductase (DIM6/NTAB) family NADH-FMN oxidoreductase RutF|uniref:Flavin reductase family protein n=1 Tax=Neoroseomonas terrae TaxID=424799 RepID=A0ABS5EIQ1_9PROT|nr:flavin reductase family protein [Neoroseomonas terrae]MBR0650881.1 flavin reductase family protein [Neoroseomonas terrae]
MEFDFDALPARERYKLMVSTVVPRPIAWVVTTDAEGRVNAAPYSFFGLLSDDPPILSVGIAPRPDGELKHTLLNIETRREFTVCLVSDATAEAMNVTAADVPAGVDEVALAGLTPVPSTRIGVPRIAESPVAMECVVHDRLPLGRRVAVLGRIIALHVHDDCVLDPQRRYIDTPKLDLVGRLHGESAYARIRDRFDLARPDTARITEAAAAGRPVPRTERF